MIHIDIKKLGRFDGIGHRITGDGRPEQQPRCRLGVRPRLHRRLIPHRLLPGHVRRERNSAIAFLKAAVAYYAKSRRDGQRVMTDNGSCYLFAFGKPAETWHQAHQDQPHTPKQTARPSASSRQACGNGPTPGPIPPQTTVLPNSPRWLQYNWHRPHGISSQSTHQPHRPTGNDLLRLHSRTLSRSMFHKSRDRAKTRGEAFTSLAPYYNQAWRTFPASNAPNSCSCRRRSTMMSAPTTRSRSIDAFVDGLDLVEAGFGRVQPKATDRRAMRRAICPSSASRRSQLRAVEPPTGTASHRNIEVIWPSRTLKPDFKTIADFCADNRPRSRPYFACSRCYQAARSVRRESLAVDGTRIKAATTRIATSPAIAGDLHQGRRRTAGGLLRASTRATRLKKRRAARGEKSRGENRGLEQEAKQRRRHAEEPRTHGRRPDIPHRSRQPRHGGAHPRRRRYNIQVAVDAKNS